MRALASFVCVLAACSKWSDPCFTPPSVVEDLRVLAVAADPPEARVDLATRAAEPVRLRALIVMPSGEVTSAQVSLELCPIGDAPGCPPGSGVRSDPAWGVGSSFNVQVPPELIGRAIDADPLRGLRDVRVRAVLRVKGARPASASTVLRFSPSGGPLNKAPVIAGLRTARQGQPLQDQSGPYLALTVARANAMRPVLADGSLEEYDALDLAGNPVHLRERVTWSFYAHESLALGRGLQIVQGALPVVKYQGLDDFEADEPEPGSPEPRDGLFLAVPVAAGGSFGTLWIVARDSRGAASWTAVPYIASEERTECSGPPPQFSCPHLLFGCQ